MSQFQAIKCDECGRIKGEVNHWLNMAVHHTFMKGRTPSVENATIVALGQVGDENSLILGHSMGLAGMVEHNEIHDLCGQECAVKHIAKLLKWNVPNETS